MMGAASLLHFLGPEAHTTLHFRVPEGPSSKSPCRAPVPGALVGIAVVVWSTLLAPHSCPPSIFLFLSVVLFH